MLCICPSVAGFSSLCIMSSCSFILSQMAELPSLLRLSNIPLIVNTTFSLSPWQILIYLHDVTVQQSWEEMQGVHSFMVFLIYGYDRYKKNPEDIGNSKYSKIIRI